MVQGALITVGCMSWRLFSPTGACFVLTSLLLCARPGVWPQPQSWTLSRTVHTQLSPVCQKQRHGSVLTQVWVLTGSGRSLPRAPTCPSLCQLLGQHLDPVGRGTAALSGKPVNYSQAQSGFPHRHRALQLCQLMGCANPRATGPAPHTGPWQGQSCGIYFPQGSAVAPSQGPRASQHPKKGLPSDLGLPKPAVCAQSSAQAGGN